MVFSSGSSVAYAAVVYVIYQVPKVTAEISNSSLPEETFSLSLTNDEVYKARLLLSKAKVTSLKGTMVPRAEMNRLVITTEIVDLSLASMNEIPSSVSFCLNYDCAISIIESEEHINKPYFANRRAIVKGRIQQWQEKYPEIHIEPLQLITSNSNSHLHI